MQPLASAQDTRAWLFNFDSDTAVLQYGTPESDDVVLVISWLTGLEAIGQVMDPDPFTAVQNALQFYPADEIVVSTFPETRSGWLRSDLIQRIKDSTSKPVDHVVVDAEPAKVSS